MRPWFLWRCPDHKHTVKMAARAADVGGSVIATAVRYGDEDVPLFISTTDSEELILPRKDTGARSHQQTFLASETGGVIVTSTRKSGSSPSSPVLACSRKTTGKWNEGDESTLPTFLSVSDVDSGVSEEEDIDKSIFRRIEARAQFKHREKLNRLSDRNTTRPILERSRHMYNQLIENNKIKQEEERKPAGAHGLVAIATVSSRLFAKSLMACNCSTPSDGRDDVVEYPGAIKSKILACAAQCHDEGVEEIADHRGLIIDVPQCVTRRYSNGESTVVTQDDEMSSLSGASYYRFRLPFGRSQKIAGKRVMNRRRVKTVLQQQQ